MSDFKFACPGCGQRIAASDDYVGQQINCPACRAPIVVPSNPAAPAAPPPTPSIAIKAPPGMPPPPAPPKVTKLGVAGTNVPPGHSSIPVPTPEQQGSAIYRAHLANKPKKSYTGAIVGSVAVVLVAVSVLLNWNSLAGLLHISRGPTPAEAAAAEAAAVAAAAAKTPPPPPEPATAGEVMQRVADVYRQLQNFSSTGTAVAEYVTPALASRGPQTVSSDLTLKMSKPNKFRIDMTLPSVQGEITMTGWSAGTGDFLEANNLRIPVTSRDDLFSRFENVAGVGVGVGVGEIVRLFTSDTTGGFSKHGLEWTLNDDESVDHTVDGDPCFVLAGTVKLQDVLVWVSKKSFLIPQVQVKLGTMAGMDDDKIKELLKAQNKGVEPTFAQLAAAKQLAKITGTITDTYANIQTNVTIAMTDIQPAGFTATGMPAQGGVNGQVDPNGTGRASNIANGRGGSGRNGGGGGGGGQGGGGGRGGGGGMGGGGGGRGGGGRR
jgi:DNA-directed RNA polymerase subunit RPC12/RpoP